jgi:Fur family ferric uptake transcriptional regulator
MVDFRENKDLFQQQGIKNTKSRNIIYDILVNLKAPISAEEIFMLVKGTECTINLSTVYRILELFVEKGIILKSIMHDKNKALYEINSMEHKHNIVCLCCKQTFPMKECPFGELEKSIEEKMGFDVRGHKLEIYGYCNYCKAK